MGKNQKTIFEFLKKHKKPFQLFNLEYKLKINKAILFNTLRSLEARGLVKATWYESDYYRGNYRLGDTLWFVPKKLNKRLE